MEGEDATRIWLRGWTRLCLGARGCALSLDVCHVKELSGALEKRKQVRAQISLTG